MKRIYIAGPYNGPDVINVLANMRRGIAASVELVRAGHAVWCPWLDFQFGLIAEIPMADYKRNSLAWVEVSDAILLLDGWEKSQGCRAELEEARSCGIGIFTSIESLLDWIGREDEDSLPDQEELEEIKGDILYQELKEGER